MLFSSLPFLFAKAKPGGIHTGDFYVMKSERHVGKYLCVWVEFRVEGKKVEKKRYMMDYERALSVAGATVHKYAQFGDWQGTWMALVTHKGETGFVYGGFGSCGHCDALQRIYDNYEDAERVQEELLEIANSWLDDILTPEQALAYAKKDMEWDYDSETMYRWTVDACLSIPTIVKEESNANDRSKNEKGV